MKQRQRNVPFACVVDAVHAVAKIPVDEIRIAVEHFAWQTFRCIKTRR